MTAPQIYRLDLTRFRAFESLRWFPSPGMNVILGGGNVGKSTVLDAVALLLHPSNGYTLSDSDYWLREVEEEFLIEAVMHLPDTTGVNRQAGVAWPWEWDGQDAVLPADGADGAPRFPVYKVRVRGTADLELVHEIVQPDNSVIGFSVSLRRGIGVVRPAGDDRSDRDLRLIQGGALDRLLDDKPLRARLGRKVALDAVEGELSEEARQRLRTLDTTFGERALPQGLGLGFVGGAGLSINALVGLTAKKGEVSLPLVSWGSGTRRLASLTIADSIQEGAPITVVDELERGLEPYRQRRLVQALRETPSQTIVTTHSASVIGAAAGTSLWYIDAMGGIGGLPTEKVAIHQAKDPEAFLARLTIVAEGVTEVGFLIELLTRYVAADWRDRGIHVTDGGGNDNVLALLEALLSGGVKFAGFADCELANPAPGRWQRVRNSLGDLLLRWDRGCLEENILPYFNAAHLERLIADPQDRRTGQRRRSLADRLGIADTSIEAITAAAGDRLMAVVVEAATGVVPGAIAEDREKKGIYKGHASQWFKSLDGGRELATKLVDLGVWSAARPRFLLFLNAVRRTQGLPELAGDAL